MGRESGSFFLCIGLVFRNVHHRGMLLIERRQVFLSRVHWGNGKEMRIGLNDSLVLLYSIASLAMPVPVSGQGKVPN
jgi:hypothetical protein